MKRILVVLIAALIAAVSFGQVTKANPGSLFDPTLRNPFTDNVARRVGDILTVIVDEKTLANFAASTQAKKNDSSGVSAKFFVSLLDSIFKPLSTGSNSSVSGNGETSQTSRMSATMSVIVKQVMPNGNLVVEGRRTLITNKETQTILFSGIVRPANIRPNNTVLSTNVAEAEVKMDGKGLISQRQRKGILTQLVDWLF
jgi:flagellar L-ring protein precursor FlgH